MTNPSANRSRLNHSLAHLIQAGEARLNRLKPLTGSEPTNPFPWRDLDILITIPPPGSNAPKT